jgi:NAD-dependent dihydropyrimidine dehydrogenase PreA subunit
MPLFGLRLTRPTRPPLWPASVPIFKPLPLPPKLNVPIPAAHIPAPGTRVKAADPMLDSVPESSHVPIAPAAGVIGSAQIVHLIGTKTAAAVEIAVDPQEPAAAADASAAQPSRFAFRAAGTAPPLRSGELVSWVQWLRANGVWADRHASPAFIDQLNAAIQRPIHTVICTVLDADPLLRLQAAVAATYSDDVAEAVALLGKLTGAKRTLLATEAGAPDTWSRPIRHAADHAGIKVIELPNDYPQSDPSLLLFTLLNRRLRPGHLPTEQGVIVLDAATALAVGRCLHAPSPMRTVPVGVLDHDTHDAEFVEVAVGTPLAFVLESSDRWTSDLRNLAARGGDMLRDVVIPTDSIVAGGELTIHIMARPDPVNPQPCIRCGWCLQACPTRVHPARLLEAAQLSDFTLADHAGLDSCIECGICSHVCPSQLPLLPGIRKLKWSHP